MLLAGASFTGRAEKIVLHLKNGDRLAGEVISDDTNRVVISTSWIKELAIPAAEIERREPLLPLIPAPIIPAPAPVPVVVKPVVAAPAAPKPKFWNAEARIGADFLQGVKNQEIYYGRFNHAYSRPYHASGIQSFRNVIDYSVDYGFTQNPSTSGNNNNSVVSANRMFGSDKTGFDIGKGRWFLYDQVAAGYDKIRKINFQDEVGPGFGYHLITRPPLTMNLEGGFDYQEQYRSDQTTTKDFYLRLSEDITWKINRDITFSEKIEITPRADFAEFRARAEATLTYALWRNLSLNLSVLDAYDTRPAQDVTFNDLQVHTSIGVKF